MMKSIKKIKKNNNSNDNPNLLLLLGYPYDDEIYTMHDSIDTITIVTCIVNDSK